MQASVNAFSLAGHPHFGLHPDPASTLAVVDGKWRDTTKLKFNHAVHNGVDGLKDNCVACHTPMIPSPTASAIATPGQPLLVSQDRPLSANAQGGGGDMMPISFERNCAQCHKLELSPGLTVPHRSLATIRGSLSAVPALAISQIKITADDISDDNPTPAAALKAKITKMASKVADLKASPAEAASNADGEATNGNDDNQRSYYHQKAAALKYLAWLATGKDGRSALTTTTQPAPGSDADATDAPARFATTQPLGSDKYDVPDPAISEIFLAYVGTSPNNACSMCHEMNGGDVAGGSAV